MHPGGTTQRLVAFPVTEGEAVGKSLNKKALLTNRSAPSQNQRHHQCKVGTAWYAEYFQQVAGNSTKSS
jgi:hypothetical protein